MLLARTTPIDQCKRPVDGLTLFYAPLDRRYVETSKIAKLGRNAMESCTVFFDGLPIAPEDRIGEEGKGFYYLLDGLNPERILVASEGISLGKVALARATEYARDRVVFGRSEEHTSEPQSLMRISYAAFCLKKQKKKRH